MFGIGSSMLLFIYIIMPILAVFGVFVLIGFIDKFIKSMEKIAASLEKNSQ